MHGQVSLQCHIWYNNLLWARLERYVVGWLPRTCFQSYNGTYNFSFKRETSRAVKRQRVFKPVKSREILQRERFPLKEFDRLIALIAESERPFRPHSHFFAFSIQSCSWHYHHWLILLLRICDSHRKLLRQFSNMYMVVIAKISLSHWLNTESYLESFAFRRFHS